MEASVDIETKLKGILDRMPQSVRDALLLFVGALLSWASIAAAGVTVPGNPLATGVFASAAVSLAGTATLRWTKFTKQYGSGSED
jgi:hypothetical protein